MKHLYVILGYGVPKVMRTDVNNQLYLRAAFNRVYQDVVDRGVQPTIVSSGGRTDMFRPYRRTEGGEMTKELRRMWRGVPSKYRRGWKIVGETRALSTLENLLLTKRFLSGQKKVTVFCEITRVGRVRRFAARVYGRRVQVQGVDFDASSTRYLDPEFLRKKERGAAQFDTWALRSPANMRHHHHVYAEKVRRMRRAIASGKDHAQAVQEWFKLAMKKLPEVQRRDYK